MRLLTKTGIAVVTLAVVWSTSIRADEEGKGKKDGEKKSVEIKDGKLNILGKEGKLHQVQIGVDKKDSQDGKGKKAAVRRRVIVSTSNEETIKIDGKSGAKIQGKIIIVGPDGKRREIDLGNADGKSRRIQFKVEWKDGADGEGKKGAVRRFIINTGEGNQVFELDGKSGAKIQGKIIIVGPDGKRREINIGDAAGKLNRVHFGFDKKDGDDGKGKQVRVLRRVIVTGDKKHTINIDKTGAKVQGKIVIVGPDGKAHEIHLGHVGGNSIQIPRIIKGDGKVIILGSDGKNREFQLKDLGGGVWNHGIHIGGVGVGGGEYVIGLDCEPATDALRAQLKLKAGLVVNSVFDNTPAQKAGIKKYDVVTHAGKQALGSLEQLIKAVQNAGKNDKELTLTAIRGGNKLTIRVKPAVRKGIQFKLDSIAKDHPELKKLLEKATKAGGVNQFHFENFGPGRIVKELHFTDKDSSSLKQRVDELSRQVEELKKALQKNSKKPSKKSKKK